MKSYSIADALISANLNRETEEIWSPFLVNGDKADAEIKLNWSMSPPYYYGVNVFEPEYNGRILKKDAAVLFADRGWTDATLYADTSESANSLLILFLYSYLVTRRTLLLHSSLVDYNGNGIMFLGPSGIGKTTQAELWNRYFGAEILNGDLVFVRENEDGFYGYGSPWHGSSPYYLNAKVRLKALIALEQAPDNKIRELSGMEVLHGIMDQVFLPHWYQEAMDGALGTLDALLTQVPFYHLACRPDKEAAELVKSILKLD